MGVYRMSAYIPTTRNNPCPVCGDTKGKCRTFADSSMVLCMENASVDLEALIDNRHGISYRCVGYTSDYRCGKFFPEAERREQHEQWSERQRAEWIAKRQRLEEQRRQAELKKRQQSLPVAERDRLYRELLAELTLHPADRGDLLRRGYSEEEIRTNGYKSVEKWQRLTREYDIGLAGVNLNGRSLNIPFPGYLCPTRDENGCITGAQIRNRNPNAKHKGQPKYYWLTSKTKKRPNGPTAHLYPEGCKRDGELPLAIFRPDGTPIGIALVEGTGPKPDLASQRLDAIVVGAGGGLWDASPVTLKQTLDALFQENPHLCEEITLYPDGGDVRNYHCMERDRRVYDLLTSLGYRVGIAWWNQIPKGNDIDQLEDLSLIRKIAWEEFWEIGLQQCPQLREKADSEGEQGSRERGSAFKKGSRGAGRGGARSRRGAGEPGEGELPRQGEGEWGERERYFLPTPNSQLLYSKNQLPTPHSSAQETNSQLLYSRNLLPTPPLKNSNASNKSQNAEKGRTTSTSSTTG